MRDRRPLALAAVLALACATTLGTIGGSAQGAKKGGGKSATERASNVPIATAAAANQDAETNVRLEVGKKFKGRVVGLVEVTTQVTGFAPGYISDIDVRLISPQGRAVGLSEPTFSGGSNQTYGPLTETPNSSLFTCGDDPCNDPRSIGPPYVGTVGNQALATFFGSRMRGTWILEITDFDPPDAGVLNSVTLKVKPAKPIE